MENFRLNYEEFKVQARDLVDKVRSLIHAGNVRRIMIRDERGNTFLEIPLTIAAIGVIAAPVLAAVGALAALVSNFSIVVERAKEEAAAGEQPESAAPPPA